MKAVGWIFLVLLGVALAVGVFWAKQHYQGLAAERAQLAARVPELQGELERIRKDREASQQRVTAAQQDLKATQGEIEQLRQQRAEAERRLAMVKELTHKFQTMINTGKLKLIERRGRMVVKMPAEVLFPSGSAELSPEGKTTLAEVAAVLKGDPKRRLMVAGHTDSQPIADANYRSNWELSAERAVTVTEFLISAGIRPGNLVAAGFAEHDPIGNNGSANGRKENRRIELMIEPTTLGELPGIVNEVATVAASSSGGTPSAAPAPGPAASAAAR
jgi:chemotaxis protein MotB